jgi:DNA-binding transcriptional MerR regulator
LVAQEPTHLRLGPSASPSTCDPAALRVPLIRWAGSLLALVRSSRTCAGTTWRTRAGWLAGVSGDRIGQWARRGYIKSSVSSKVPRVYYQDVAEAMVVHELLDRGVPLQKIKRAITILRADYGDWPLTHAPILTAETHLATGRVGAALALERPEGELTDLDRDPEPAPHRGRPRPPERPTSRQGHTRAGRAGRASGMNPRRAPDAQAGLRHLSEADGRRSTVVGSHRGLRRSGLRCGHACDSRHRRQPEQAHRHRAEAPRAGRHSPVRAPTPARQGPRALAGPRRSL